jgi:hypothetical protein
MPKKPSIVFSKKLMPPDARRITNEQGIRVWQIGNRQFTSKRAYFTWLQVGDPPPPKTEAVEPPKVGSVVEEYEVDEEAETEAALLAEVLPENFDFEEEE